MRLLYSLSTMPAHPESVPINALVPIAGTPLGEGSTGDETSSSQQQQKGKVPSAIDMTRMIATARCIMPRTMLRLSAGRMSYTEAEQGLMMLAGASLIQICQRRHAKQI